MSLIIKQFEGWLSNLYWKHVPDISQLYGHFFLHFFEKCKIKSNFCITYSTVTVWNY